MKELLYIRVNSTNTKMRIKTEMQVCTANKKRRKNHTQTIYECVYAYAVVYLRETTQEIILKISIKITDDISYETETSSDIFSFLCLILLHENSCMKIDRNCMNKEQMSSRILSFQNDFFQPHHALRDKNDDGNNVDNDSMLV